MSKSKKTILTEDVFNSNGDSKVSSKVLKESKETTEETKEEILESITNEDEIIVDDKKEKQSKYDNKTYIGFNDEMFYC